MAGKKIRSGTGAAAVASLGSGGTVVRCDRAKFRHVVRAWLAGDDEGQCYIGHMAATDRLRYNCFPGQQDRVRYAVLGPHVVWSCRPG